MDTKTEDEQARPIGDIHATASAPPDTTMTDAPIISEDPNLKHSTITVPPPRTTTPSTTTSKPILGTTDASFPLPSQAAAHGAPTRRYLNEKVTGVLLEGMKRLAAEQPAAPLRVLGEYLLKRSAELESQEG